MEFKSILGLILLFMCLHSNAQVAKASKYQDSLKLLIKTASEQPEQTLKNSDSLIDLAKRSKKYNTYASLLLAKGIAYSFLGNNTEALKHQIRAHSIFDSINDSTGRALSLLNISFSHIHLKNDKKAIEYLLQALSITDKNNSKLLTNIYANLGNSYIELGEIDKGIGYLEKSLIHYKKTDNPTAIALIYYGIANAKKQLKEEKSAENYLLLALEYQKKSSSDYALSVIALNLGNLYLEQGKLEASKKFFDIAEGATERINLPYYTQDYNLSMVNWYKAKGNYQQALKTFENYVLLKDSVYSLESTKLNNELEVKFQNKLKSKEIELLKTQKKLATAEIDKNRFWALILILITILCIVVIVVLYQNFNAHKKSNALLKLEKLQLSEMNRLLENENILVQFETLKTQVSPHFLFNSLNALTSLIKTDTKKALRFTKEFSKIFRSTLELKEKNIITLKEELDHVNSYLYLQKMRFDSNLIIDVTIDSDFFNDFLPPFSLQMVIENAIKHNVITTESPLKIEVTAKGHFLIVTNNLQVRKIKEDSTKTGVKNIISRYKYISDLEPSFETTNNLFYVKLPLIKEEV